MFSILLVRIVSQGIGYLDWDFFTNFASRNPEKAGIKAALVGSIYMMCIVAPVSMILGVGNSHLLRRICEEK